MSECLFADGCRREGGCEHGRIRLCETPTSETKPTPTCNCRVVIVKHIDSINAPPIDITHCIQYCPLHAAAQDLFDALKSFEMAMYDGAKAKDLANALGVAKSAIARAQRGA